MDKETEKEIKQFILDYKVSQEVSKLVRAVCITSTGTLITFFIWIGGIIYDRFDAVSSGVRAFLEALRHQ